MDRLFFIFTLTLVSCSDTNHDSMCVDYQVNILELEHEIEKLFEENGNLREQLKGCEAYLKSLDVDGN